MFQIASAEVLVSDLLKISVRGLNGPDYSSLGPAQPAWQQPWHSQAQSKNTKFWLGSGPTNYFSDIGSDHLGLSDFNFLHDCLIFSNLLKQLV